MSNFQHIWNFGEWDLYNNRFKSDNNDLLLSWDLYNNPPKSNNQSSSRNAGATNTPGNPAFSALGPYAAAAGAAIGAIENIFNQKANKREIRAFNRNIDRGINYLKNDNKNLGITTAEASAWAERMMASGNPQSAGAISQMYSQNINAAKDKDIATQNKITELEMQKMNVPKFNWGNFISATASSALGTAETFKFLL